jgi:DNA-binding transcriptional LysR family regulator
MPIDSIADARTFVLVVEGGSLSAAARALQVSPNAVSQRVRAMEARAGVRLLNRTTRSMSLTEEGEALYRRCVRIVAEAEAAADDVGGGGGFAGRVRIAVPTVLGGSPTLRALGALHAEHPALRIQLIVSDDRSLDLVGAGIDLAVLYGEPAESGLIVRRLGDVAFALCAAPSYLDARGRPETPGDLAVHDGLRFLESPPQGTWYLTGPDGRDTEVEVGGWFECDSSRALGDAVYAGLGIGVRPEQEVASAGGRIERVLPGWRFGRAPLVALMPPGRHRLRRVRAVLDVVAAVAVETILA